MTKEQFNNLKDGQLIYVQDQFNIFNSSFRTDEGYKFYFLTYKPEDIQLATREMVENDYKKNLDTVNKRHNQMLQALALNEG